MRKSIRASSLNQDVYSFGVDQTVVVPSIGSSESVPSQYLYKAAYNNFSSQLYAPAFETGYYDIFALSREFGEDPDFNLSFNNINTNYLFSIDNFNMQGAQEADAGQSGYETRQFYTLAVDPVTGKPVLNTTDTSTLDASITSITALESNARPQRTGYTGYLVADGFPSNGYDFGHGIQFPEMPADNDFFLRTDFLPNRLFKLNGTRWVKIEDAVRMNMTNNDTKNTLKSGFINNTAYIFNEAECSGRSYLIAIRCSIRQRK
jgi:hypothetical protein